MKTGLVRSSFHVTVLDVVYVLPVASTAVNDLVCDFIHVPVIPPVTIVTVEVPQLSVAEAEPRAASISDDEGLHSKVDVVPVAEIVGAVLSL